LVRRMESNINTMPVTASQSLPAVGRTAQAAGEASAAAAAQPVMAGLSGQDLQALLAKAQVPMQKGFQKVGAVSGADFAAFRWDTGVVFGTAEQQRIGNPAAFDAAITSYLRKTRDRCSGSYDQSYQGVQKQASATFAMADVACVMPDGSGAGAAMVFFYKDGLFNVVAHEGEVKHFRDTMGIRDRVLKSITGG